MSFKRAMVVTTISTLTLASAAFAAEGGGDPFPGPNAAVTENVQNPHYTMGGAAPFNFFYTPPPTRVDASRMPGVATDPVPFRAAGQVIKVQPVPWPGSHG